MCEKNIRFCILRTLSLGLRPSLAPQKIARPAPKRKPLAALAPPTSVIAAEFGRLLLKQLKRTDKKDFGASQRSRDARDKISSSASPSRPQRELAVLSTAARTRSCSLRSPSCAPFFGSGRDRPRPGSSRGHVRAGGGHAAGRATAHATRRSGRCRRRRRTGCCRHRDTAELVAEQEDGSARRRCTGPSPCTPVSWRV